MREQRPWDCAILGLVHSLRNLRFRPLLLFDKLVDSGQRNLRFQPEY